jgi:hypothetical protein
VTDNLTITLRDRGQPWTLSEFEYKELVYAIVDQRNISLGMWLRYRTLNFIDDVLKNQYGFDREKHDLEHLRNTFGKPVRLSVQKRKTLNKKFAADNTSVHTRRRRLFKEQQGRCFYCGRICQLTNDVRAVNRFTIDHVIPRSQGGKIKRNVVGACHRCNDLKGNRDVWEFVAAELDGKVWGNITPLLAAIGRPLEITQAWVDEAQFLPTPEILTPTKETVT